MRFFHTLTEVRVEYPFRHTPGNPKKSLYEHTGLRSKPGEVPLPPIRQVLFSTSGLFGVRYLGFFASEGTIPTLQKQL